MDAKIEQMLKNQSVVKAAEDEATRLMLALYQAREDGDAASVATLKPQVKAARQAHEAALDASLRWMRENGM